MMASGRDKQHIFPMPPFRGEQPWCFVARRLPRRERISVARLLPILRSFQSLIWG